MWFIAANSSPCGQEISRILRNQTLPCRVHKRPPLVSILSQINPFHAIPVKSTAVLSSQLTYEMFLTTALHTGRERKLIVMWLHFRMDVPCCHHWTPTVEIIILVRSVWVRAKFGRSLWVVV
jgi:hypothetical protein